MKAITIRQPHVAAIFAGVKRYEYRSWATSHRGPLAIHAAKAVDDTEYDGLVFDEASLGCVVGKVQLVACIPSAMLRLRNVPSGLFAFELKRPEAFKIYVPIRGRLGLWDYSGPGSKD
jgi:hypothetical protein